MVSSPFGVWLVACRDAKVQTTPGVWGDRLPPIPVIYDNQSAETHGTSRGELRLLSAHDRRIYGAWPCDGYRTLSCVADSSRSPPASNPPALHLLGAGHTCTSTRAFASGLLQAHIAVTPLPSATLRLRQAGSGLCPVAVSNYRTAPFSSRAKARHTTRRCWGRRGPCRPKAFQVCSVQASEPDRF